MWYFYAGGSLMEYLFVDADTNSTIVTDEYDKHPNEVVKNEELTYNSSCNPSALLWLCVLLACCLVGR